MGDLEDAALAWHGGQTLPPARVGDIFANKALPLTDKNAGGSGVEIPDTVNKAYNAIKNVDTIITGHSTLMTPADLKEVAEFNNDFATPLPSTTVPTTPDPACAGTPG